jgi:Tol biopolymer transport system component
VTFAKLIITSLCLTRYSGKLYTNLMKKSIISLGVFFPIFVFQSISIAQFQIAYLAINKSSQDLYIVDQFGNNSRRLTYNEYVGDLSWSPDASKIAFITSKLNVSDTDGWNRKLITAKPNLNVVSVAWSPDTNYIAYASKVNTNNPLDTCDLFLVNSSGLNNRRITFGECGYDAGHLKWSHKGDKIAYTYVYKKDSVTTERWLSVVSANGALSSNNWSSKHLTKVIIDRGSWFDWSPDDKNIVCMKYEVSGLRIINVETGVVDSSFFVNSGEFPSWSPDGSKIAFSNYSVTIDTGYTDSIYKGLYSIQNNVITTIFKDGFDVRDSRWSPDGKMIAFSKEKPIFKYPLCVINSDGSGFKIIADSTDYQLQPTWSPVQITSKTRHNDVRLTLGSSLKKTSHNLIGMHRYNVLGETTQKQNMASGVYLSKDEAEKGASKFRIKIK